MMEVSFRLVILIFLFFIHELLPLDTSSEAGERSGDTLFLVFTDQHVIRADRDARQCLYPV